MLNDCLPISKKFQFIKKMTMNKSGKSQDWMVWVIIAIGALVVFGGDIGNLNLFSSDDTSQSDTLYPSDMKTTVTLNTGDKLATTATNVNVSYYVFNSAGKYLKEGTTSAGTASFTVPTAGNYDVILYDDTSAAVALDYLYKKVSFSTDGNSPQDRAVTTVNVDMVKESNTTIEAVQDPVDLDANVSHGAGQTVNYNLLISAETSNAAVNEPVIRVVYNSSCVESMTVKGLTEGTCPDRLTTATGFNDACFKDDIVLESSDGIKTYSGTILIDKTSSCPTVLGSSNVTFSVLDTGIYPEADYKTQGISAFKFGTENPVDNSNIGSGDSADAFLYFN